MLMDGLHVPLTLPFYRDGRSYLRKLEHNVARYSLTPANGLVALAPGTEANTLSDAETAEALRVVGQTAAPEKVLVAGIARDSVHGALALAEVAEAAGFDALLLVPPRDWPELGLDEDLAPLLLFFRAVADAAALPVMLWSGAGGASQEVPVRVVAELSAHPNVIGLYDPGLTVERNRALVAATKDARRDVTVTTVFAPVTRRMLAQQAEGAATFVSAEALGGGAAVAVAPPRPALKTRTKTVGFQIMAAGRASQMLPLLEAGATGAMPNLAACAPQGCYEVLAALKDGNSTLAAEKAARLEKADEAIRRLGIAGVKYGCDFNGYFGGTPRLPRLPLTAEQRAEVEEALREVRN